VSKYRVFKGILPEELSLFPKRRLQNAELFLFREVVSLSVRSLAFNPSVADNPIIQLFLTSLKKNADKRYVRAVLAKTYKRRAKAIQAKKCHGY